MKNLVKNVIILLVVIMLSNTLISFGIARVNAKTYDYTVEECDTLWKIASEICKGNVDLSINNVIYDIKRINGLKESIIYKGQTLKLPIYN